MKHSTILLSVIATTVAGAGLWVAQAGNSSTELKAELHLISDKGVGESVGSVRISDSPNGAVLKPDLKGLPPGLHGFHIHQNPDCGAKIKDGKMMAGEAAGPHFDPANTGKHAGPEGHGHAGDLPQLVVAADGKATTALTAPRLKTADLKNRSLMIHTEGDNYADKPGGGRIACGVVK